MSKRSKLILGIVIGAMIILSGTVFGLAKTGKINLKMLADVITQNTGSNVNVVLNVSRSDGQPASGQQIVLHQKSASSTSLGTQVGIIIVGANNQATFSVARNYWYDFDQIAPPCHGALMNVHITSTTGSPVTYGLTLNCGGTGTCGGQTCTANQHCNASNICVNNCTATSCPAGQTCNALTKECQTGTQTPHKLTLYIGVKTDCTDAVCTNKDSYSKVGGIPVSFGSFSGTTNNSLSQGYNLQFDNVMTGNYTFKINDSAAAGYNSVYESKTVTQNVYNPTGSTLALFNLAKKNVTPGGGTYSLVGYVKDSVTDKFLSGVSVGGVTTGTDGKYTINNLPHASYQTQTFVFHKDGYTDQTKTLAQLGLQGIIANQPVSYAAQLLKLVPNTTATKFSFIGAVKLQGVDVMLGGVTVKISCVTGTSCSGGPWTTTSSGSKLTTYPNITADYNFVIANIPILQDGSQLKVEFLKDGLFYDENSNGANDEQSTAYISAKTSSVWSNVGPGNAYVNLYTHHTATMIGRSTFKVLGAITILGAPDTMVAGLKISVVGLEMKNGAMSPNEDSRRSATTTGNHLSNQYSINANYLFAVGVPDYYLQYRITVTDPNDNFPIFEPTVDFNRSQIQGIYTATSHYVYNASTNLPRRNYFVATIKNSATDQRIPGAVAVIYDPVCGVIEQAQASADGIALIGGNFSVYHQAVSDRNYTGTRYKNCLSPELIVTKPGYFKYISVIGRKSTSETARLLPETNTPANSVSGIVTQNGTPITGATISIWHGTNPNPAAALPSLTSNAEGKFSTGTLPRGKYIVIATKPGYLRDAKSIVYFEIFGTEKVYIDLKLQFPNPDRLFFKSIVLEKDFLTGIKDASLEVKDLKDDKVIQNSNTDEEGATTLYLTIGNNYQIKAKKGSAEQTKNINIPANYNSYSEQQKQDFNKQLIFKLDTNTAHANTYPEITFKVVDQNNNPVKGAKISFDYLTFGGSDSEMGIQSNVYATTNGNGKARFKSDFMASIKAPNLTELMSQKTLFSLDDTLENFNVTKAGYAYWPDMASGRAYKLKNIGADISKCPQADTCTIIIKMWRMRPGYGELSVGVSEFLSNHDDAYFQSMLNQISLEKQNSNGSWSPYSTNNHENNVNKNYAYRFFWDLPNGKYRAKIASINTTSEVATLNNSSEYVELRYCSSQGSQYIYSFNDKIKLIFFSDNQYQRFQRNHELYNHIGQTVADMMSFSNNTHPVVVALNDDVDINASAYTIRLSCLGFQDAGLINIQEGIMQFYEKTGTSWELDGTVVHEYAHIILEDYRQSNNTFYQRWLELYNMINGSTNKTLKDCVWGTIKDSDSSNIIMAFGGHPWDDESEMFASFTNDYFLYHDKLRDNIQLNCPAASQCQNIIEYMWTLYSEGVGSMQASDTVIFEPIFGGVTGSRYTFEQIASGKWKQSVYNGLGIIEKSKVQFSRFVLPFVNSTRQAVSTMIARFNNFIATLLGAFPNRGTVAGKITNRSGQGVANIVVQIGPLAGITDASGNYSIAGIPEGEQIIIRAQHVGDGHIYRIITPTNSKFNVIKNTTVRGNIVIN